MSSMDRHIDDMYEDSFLRESLYSDFAKRNGESYHSLSVLYVLGESPQGISQKQLTAELFLPKQTVGSIITAFEKRGDVVHRQDARDKRSKLHSLTAQGAHRCTAIMQDLRNMELACARSIGEEDMARIHTITKRYLDLFEQQLEARKNG